MIKNNLFPLLILLMATLVTGCTKEFDKYERPNWLDGKVYTQIKEIPELSIFSACIDRIGYDEILDVSGSYTVFAPSNDAFNAYLSSKSEYNSVDDIPLAELDRIVRYHIVQNPWTKKQLRELDVFGWIDTMDLANNVPRGFKRETLLRDDNQNYGLKNVYGSGVTISDTLDADLVRKVATDSRKYAPIFYSEYFTINDIPISDYQFYFDRAFEGGDELYFAGSQIESEEIFAENGFVYIVDKVVPPLKNGYEMLNNESGTHSYSKFLDLINQFPRFVYNEQRTNDQEGVDLGLEVDSLFDLSFPDLAFDLNKELTQPPEGTYGLPANVTVRYQHGLVGPVDEAFDNFVNEYFNVSGGWGSLENTPLNIKRIIANTHMSQYEIFPTTFENGFLNGEKDIVSFSRSDIVEQEFGSNCSFIGVNKAVVPRAFSSVTGPVYLRPGYSKIMYAIEETGILPLLKKPNNNYMFFVEADRNSAVDSTLIYEGFTGDFYAYLRANVGGEIGGEAVELKFDRASLRTLLLRHIGSRKPSGLARKEFIPNLAGTYLVINNETGEVSGTNPTTFGYQGGTEVPEIPAVLSNADNGTTYDIQNWFSFGMESLFSQISLYFPEFHALLQKAGYSLDKEGTYSFINESDYYTALVPSAEAIQAANLDSVSVEELRQILKTHFVQGELIFTDGETSPDYYETMRVDEKSTEYSTVFTKIFINPGIDNIQIIDKSDAIHATVNESENTNIFGSKVDEIEGDNEPVYRGIVNNAVIHEIDKVLNSEEIGY